MCIYNYTITNFMFLLGVISANTKMGVYWVWLKSYFLRWSCLFQMFITIKFGADEEELFNPDCAFGVLMNDIKKRCRCSDRDSIRLLNEKAGSLVPIPDGESRDSALKLFTARGCYILLAEEKSAGVISYIPLLDDPGKELLAILESFVVGKPSKSIGRRASRTPQTTTKIMSGGKGRRK